MTVEDANEIANAKWLLYIYRSDDAKPLAVIVHYTAVKSDPLGLAEQKDLAMAETLTSVRSWVAGLLLMCSILQATILIQLRWALASLHSRPLMMFGRAALAACSNRMKVKACMGRTQSAIITNRGVLVSKARASWPESFSD